MAVRVVFLPSLKHIAIVKIAVAVFYNSRVSELIDELKELEKAGDCRSYQRVKEKWAFIEKQVYKLLKRRLPPSLINKVTGILRPLHSEVKKWQRDHEEFLPSIGENGKFILIWNSEGTINRPRTIEQWIRNGTLDIRKRFLLACTYFMESEILNLWSEMKKSDKRKLFLETANLAVRFWTDWLREGAIPATWFQIANESLDRNNVWENDYHIRVSCFYHKIDFRAKYYYFFGNTKVHSDDIRFCFNHMDGHHQRSLLFENPWNLLTSYLDWPLQSVFLKLIDSIPFQLPMRIFHGIVTHILTQKIRRGYKDADYVGILGEVWNRMNAGMQEEMKGTSIYYPLMVVLNRAKCHPFSVEEILESYCS